MGAVLALVIRAIITALVTAVPLTAAQQFLDGTFGKITAIIRDEEGLTWEEAKDVLANILVEYIQNTVIIALMVRSKIAVSIATWFGFGSKGFVKKAVSIKVASAVTKYTGAAGVTLAKKAISPIIKFLVGIGGFVWLTKALADIIEPGIYKPEQANAVYRKLGIPFQYPTAGEKQEPGPFDAKEFNEYATSIESAGVTGINNPGAQQTQIYSRENLVQVIEYVYGQEALRGNALSKKEVIEKLGQYLIRGKPAVNIPSVTNGKTGAAAAPTGVKVFTGIVSQGKLGDAAAFTPREDDLIDSIDDLRTGAQNNLAQFLVSLPGRIVYEIKIVSQITDANGFKRRGETRRVVSSYLKDGTPRYKTVTNKFAICDVYVFTSRNVRSKIQTIVLGPTDAVAFQPNQNEIQSLEIGLRENLTTREIAEVVPTAAPAVVKPKSEIVMRFETLGLREFGLEKMAEIEERAADPGASFAVITAPFGSSGGFNPGDPSLMRDIAQKIESIKMLRAEGIKISFPNTARRLGVPEFAEADDPGRGGVSTRTSDDLNTQLRNAKTLSEWYSLQGKPLPSVAERGAIYEAFGLGQAVWYTGTAEQNIKLLAEHKSRSV